MKRFIGSILSLGFLGVASTATYYSFNSFENKDFEKWVKNLENSLEKVKNLAQTIKDKVKDFSGKEDLQDLLNNFSSLDFFEKYDKNDPTIELETLLPGEVRKIKTEKEIETELKNKIEELKSDIQKSKEEIRKKNPDNKDLEEIYEEIKKAGILTSEIWKKNYKLKKEINELYRKIPETLKKDFRNDFEDIENLEIKISEKQQKIEKRLENENFKDSKEEIQKWLHLNKKYSQFSILLNILFNVFNDIKN